jgi:hypothetical protein
MKQIPPHLLPRQNGPKAKRLRGQDKVDLIMALAAGDVRTLDRVYEWEQTRSQGLVIAVDHPLLGSVEIPGPRSA